MKPLNRPMFRYGGPIKEGVMSGIREPRKDGGSMNEPQAMNTVGSPLAPQGSDGRQQYAFPLLYGAGMAALRFLPAAYRGYKASRYLNPKAVTTGQKIKNFFIPRSSQSLQSGGSKFKNLSEYASKVKPGEGLGYKIGSFARTNPVSTFGIASAVPQAGYGAYKLGKAGIKGAPDLAKNYIDMVLPGEQFREPPPNITGKNNIQDTNRDDRKKIITTDGSNKGGSGSQKSAEELRKDRVQRYRDIMDIKGMNKNAAYNSLIAASQLINQEGDFKGSIKDGSLISKIIGATGKAFDKPSQTKDAIDTLILKGEIEKDLNKEKNALDNEYKRSSIALNEAKIAQDSLMGDRKSYLEKNKTLPSGQLLAGLARNRGYQVSGIEDVTEVKNWMKENGGDEVDYLKDIMTKTEIAPGVYVINTRLIQVTEDNKLQEV
jgi:hypothetical protein